MQLDKLQFTAGEWSTIHQDITQPDRADLVLVFGDSDLSAPEQLLRTLQYRYPNAWITGASSCGHVISDSINRSEAVATAIAFDQATVKGTWIDFEPGTNSEALAQQLLQQLPSADLRHLLVLSDGLNINGSRLAHGLNHSRVSVSGGLAGDSTRFQRTWVIANDLPRPNRIAAIGLYGEQLAVHCQSYAGWSPFGANRTVTRARANQLFELDHEPALALYKRYLGEFATELPASGMRFPLCINTGPDDDGVIRTLLGINEDEQSITFAGDIPEGASVRLMHPNFNRLIEGAAETVTGLGETHGANGLALVVSCGGRRSVMGVQTEEELSIIREHLPASFRISGFYSYGELGPLPHNNTLCHLHNQTITVTCIHEHPREEHRQ